MFNNFGRWLDSNRRPLVSEATALPTEPHNHCPKPFNLLLLWRSKGPEIPLAKPEPRCRHCGLDRSWWDCSRGCAGLHEVRPGRCLEKLQSSSSVGGGRILLQLQGASCWKSEACSKMQSIYISTTIMRALVRGAYLQKCLTKSTNL